MYKRQSVRSLASGIPNSHGVTGGVYKTRERIHRSILICDYREIHDSYGGKNYDLVPVSYTHLDVYKRQPYDLGYTRATMA